MWITKVMGWNILLDDWTKVYEIHKNDGETEVTPNNCWIRPEVWPFKNERIILLHNKIVFASARRRLYDERTVAHNELQQYWYYCC